MLIHVVPRIYTPVERPHGVEIVCPELGLSLDNSSGLRLVNPYAEDGWYVACRRASAQRIEGLLLQAPHVPDTFTLAVRWLLPNGTSIRHEITHVLLDRDHDLISGAMFLWLAHRDWRLRWPERYPRTWSFVQAQPRMDLIPGRNEGFFTDTTRSGRIVHRAEAIWMHSLEASRLTAPGYHGHADLPSERDAIALPPIPQRPAAGGMS